MDKKWLIGIDEVGRGPLAGPFTFGAFLIPKSEDVFFSKEVLDSKSLSASAREEWYENFLTLRKRGRATFASISYSSKLVDEIGIGKLSRRAVARLLQKLGCVPEETTVLLDGLLYAPEKFRDQSTVTHGDRVHSIIGAASIVAKVRRDRLMSRYHDQYPEYGFATNKGYGTAAHYEAIRKHGLSEIHRRSFVHLSEGR